MEALSYFGMMGDNGKFLPDSPNAFRAGAKAFAGKRVKVTLELPKEKRSDRQNRAMYGIAVKAFCDHMGYRFNSAADKEYVKREILIQVGHYEIRRGLDGTERKEPKPTKGLDKKAFSELFEAIQELGAGWGVFVADPESPQALAARA